jgi:hypothetical protein
MRIAGYNVLTDRESDRALDEFESARCGHCGGHFRVIVGSGRTRGWCSKCGVTCGQRNCAVHVENWEQWVERVEANERRIILASR